MKSSKATLTLHSFKDLKVLPEKKTFPLHHSPAPDNPSPLPKKKVTQSPETEQSLFNEAMEDVKPIFRENCREKRNALSRPEVPKEDKDAEVLIKISRLVERGEGFVVAQTPEYIEGTGYNVKPGIARRLHQGEVAIEAHLDLHGRNVAEAEETFDAFLHDIVRSGKRAVLIVHGRGLSSPEEPVLKTRVVEWLSRGPWRKWVLAYASARPCDGGAGATYVLLRRRPYTGRFKKRN